MINDTYFASSARTIYQMDKRAVTNAGRYYFLTGHREQEEKCAEPNTFN